MFSAGVISPAILLGRFRRTPSPGSDYSITPSGTRFLAEYPPSFKTGANEQEGSESARERFLWNCVLLSHVMDNVMDGVDQDSGSGGQVRTSCFPPAQEDHWLRVLFEYLWIEGTPRSRRFTVGDYSMREPFRNWYNTLCGKYGFLPMDVR